MNKFKTGLIALLAVIFSLSVIGLSTVYAWDIEETSMCYGYSETTLSPLGSTTTFLTTNMEAGVWLKIVNPPDDVTFKFFYKENNIEKEFSSAYSKEDVILKEDTNWGIAFATMDINGQTPEFKPGLWTVRIYLDGEKAAEVNFNIIDYDDLSSQISQISETVQDMVGERNELLEDYTDIAEEYASLQLDYEELEDSTVSETRLYEMNRKYEDLLDDYEGLESSQAGTKSMMYASIIVALIAVVIAVYFGVMKK